MGKISRNASTVWVVLVAITLLTWMMIEESLTSAAIYAVIILSSIKVYLIGISYMEIFRANAIFKRFFHIWVSVVLMMITAFKYFCF